MTWKFSFSGHHSLHGQQGKGVGQPWTVLCHYGTELACLPSLWGDTACKGCQDHCNRAALSCYSCLCGHVHAWSPTKWEKMVVMSGGRGQSRPPCIRSL